MKNSRVCPKCGSTAVIVPARLETAPTLGPHYEVGLAADGNPQGLIMKRTERSKLEAYVCAQCGYTELYATDLAPLSTACEEAQKRGRE